MKKKNERKAITELAHPESMKDLSDYNQRYLSISQMTRVDCVFWIHTMKF